MGSMVDTTHCPRDLNQVELTHTLQLLGQMRSLTWLCRWVELVAGICSGTTASRNTVSKDPNSDDGKLCLCSVSMGSPMAKLCRFLPPVVPKRWNKWASWKCPTTLRKLSVHLGLFFPLEKLWLRGAPLVQWCDGPGRDGFSYPSDTVRLGLCCLGGMSASSLGSGIFEMVSGLWIVDRWSFLWWGLKLGMAYVTILMTSLL